MNKFMRKFSFLVLLSFLSGVIASALALMGYPGTNVVNVLFGTLTCVVFGFFVLFDFFDLPIVLTVTMAVTVRMLVWSLLTIWKNRNLSVLTEIVVSFVSAFLGYSFLASSLQ